MGLLFPANNHTLCLTILEYRSLQKPTLSTRIYYSSEGREFTYSLAVYAYGYAYHWSWSMAIVCVSGTVPVDFICSVGLSHSIWYLTALCQHATHRPLRRFHCQDATRRQPIASWWLLKRRSRDACMEGAMHTHELSTRMEDDGCDDDGFHQPVINGRRAARVV